MLRRRAVAHPSARAVRGLTAGGVLSALAAVAAFLAPAVPAASTASAAVAPTTSIDPNCSASVSGTVLSRTGWVASTNAPAGSAFAPAYALDGSLTTRFATNGAQAPGLYFQVDMGTARTFSELAMDVPNSPTDYARAYDVQVSTNATTWSTVASCTGTATPEVVTFPAQTARYLKVVLTTSATNWWSIDELNLYTSYSCSASVSGTVLSRTGWVASTNAPAGSTYAPGYALDGSLATRFATNEVQAPGQYLQVDMGSARTFSELAMDVPNSPTDYARAYDVQVSTNATTWSTVASCTGTATPEVVTFPAQTARYLKVVLTTSATNWWSVDELNLYYLATAGPVITSASSWQVVPGQYNSFTVTASGSPTPTLSESGALPPGMAFRANTNGTALIYGTPPANITSTTGTYVVTITAANSLGTSLQHLTISLAGRAPVITSASSWQVVPGQYNSFTVTASGSPTPTLSESGALPPGMAFRANTNGTALIYGTPPVGTNGTYQVTILAVNGVGSPAFQHLVIRPALTGTTTSLSSSANPAPVGHTVVYTAKVVPVPDGGTVTFRVNGATVTGCNQVAVNTRTGTATCSAIYSSAGHLRAQASYSGHGIFGASTSGVYTEVVNVASAGYWLATASGHVYGFGSASALGDVAVSATTGPVVGIAANPSGNGYWVVTANGRVSAFGDAKFYGDLPRLGKRVSDIVAIAPTSNGKGYYLVGADGGFFTFGNARFHGSLPGIGVRTKHVVGMTATPDGRGYLLVGWDGGVFTFGNAKFHGSLPGLGKHVHNIRAILPTSTGKGYVLVGADGGVFNFGSGVKFHGSLPGRGIRVSDIVGIALTRDNGGYYLAGANGQVYAFGNAQVAPQAPGIVANLPVAAIASK